MADNDSKRYYWLKLKKDFFQQHQIKVLKALPNGRLYALIYLELLAESTSHEGELRYSKMLPYDTVTLASVIDEDKDNLESAIKTLVQLELVEVLDDGTIFMSEIKKLVGSETGSAQRKREYRQRIALNEIEGTMSQKCLQEYRDKSKEKRDKSDIRHKYGQYNNVLLSDEDIETLKKEIPNYNEYIERVSEYVASTGKTYKNYLATIRNWHRKDTGKQNTDTPPKYDKSRNRVMSNDEIEELLKLKEMR